MSAYSADELLALGLAHVGCDVHVNRTVQFFGANFIRIDDHVRIDAFAVISASSAGVRIGSFVHVGTGVFVSGSGGRVELQPFANLSAGTRIFTSNDDYIEGHLTGPMVPAGFRRVATGNVLVGRHAIIGSGSIVLPRVEIGFGAAVGALSLVKRNVAEGEIVFGNPLRRHTKSRNTVKLRELEDAFRLGQAVRSDDRSA